ncbi:MAG: hypothetical protein HFJ09_13380 [Lachnospiraceae bacterium]|nr:hypothetical protein [Lachnospiraceae bacterium]
MIVWKYSNFYRQIALGSLSILFHSSEIQVEYPLLICYNKQWNEIPIFMPMEENEDE